MTEFSASVSVPVSVPAPVSIHDIPLPFTPEDKHALRKALNIFVLDKERAIARYGNINTWVTTNVTDMSYLFTGLERQYTFNNRDDIISNWDTSNVTNMSGLFTAAHGFNQPLYWNTSKVENMSHLFSQCEFFNQLLEWDTSKVKNMKNMFFYCLRFNMPLHFSDLSNVENMDNMFTFCRCLTQNYSHWVIPNVVNYDPREMFRDTPNLYKETRWPSLTKKPETFNSLIQFFVERNVGNSRR
jgi:hypothetical protein